MSLHDEKAAALAEVLAATGEEIVWKGRTLHALVSDNPLSQELGLGGFDAKGDCTMKVLRSELGAERPKLGETLTFQGATYRITRVTDHPQFPMIVLVVEPVDLVIRGYLTRTPTLHVIAETLWRLPAQWQHPCIQFDDLLLRVAMKLRGWPCLVYRPNGNTERLIGKSLPDDFGLCHRRNHVPERVAFLRMAREHLGWKPLSDSAA